MKHLTAALISLLAVTLAVIVPAGAQPAPTGVAVVVAQLSPDRALTAGRPAPGAETAAPSGFLAGVYNWILTQQQRLNRELAAAVKELKAAGSVTAAMVLGFIGFSYGVLHAAGPGHGKAIISSYVLANRETVRRGIFLSFLSAFFQALSAIVLVGILAIALNATSVEMRAAEGWIETISWAFVTAVGAWLLYSQLRQIFAGGQPKSPVRQHTHARSLPSAASENAFGARAHQHGHRQEHDHDGGCSHGPGCSHHHASDPHDHDHHDCCGHAHMPDPKDLQGDLTWTKALAIAFSVGIRPCTGAILVLVFALSQGLLWAGVFATFAMAIGTALTVSVLAALAVGSRDLAIRMGGGESGWATAIANGTGLLGASLVLLMGAIFFMGSLQPQAPF
jgi:ABC-type nickel/cobalt efflux system permease component RcnA